MHPEQKPYGSPDFITQDMNDHLHWTCLDGFPLILSRRYRKRMIARLRRSMIELFATTKASQQRVGWRRKHSCGTALQDRGTVALYTSSLRFISEN
jgi:hypothetical protein